MEIETSIAGLRYVESYLNAEQQWSLLTLVDQQPWSSTLKRRIQQYGYRYDYRHRSVDTSMYLGVLPPWAVALASGFVADGLAPLAPDQLIVNEYLPGQGIASHIDCLPCFGERIYALSLGSACVMEFTHVRRSDRRALLLHPGSLLILQAEARYDWKHGIPARKSDTMGQFTLPRSRRVSLTFRNVLLAG